MMVMIIAQKRKRRVRQQLLISWKHRRTHTRVQAQRNRDERQPGSRARAMAAEPDGHFLKLLHSFTHLTNRKLALCGFLEVGNNSPLRVDVWSCCGQVQAGAHRQYIITSRPRGVSCLTAPHFVIRWSSRTSFHWHLGVVFMKLAGRSSIVF